MYMPQPAPTPEQFPAALLPLRETLAQRIHDAWAAGRFAEGWRWGPELDAKQRLHPGLRPYEELPESEKDYDRNTAAVTLLCLLEHGCSLECPALDK